MKKILVIDDSDVNLYLVQTIFEDYPDIEIILESDSTKTINRMGEIKPDLLVLDLMMPYKDGFELIQEIKADPGLSNTKILVVSAFLNEETVEKIENFGVTEYMNKPISLDDAELKITNLINE